jgi:hypothetical protein
VQSVSEVHVFRSDVQAPSTHVRLKQTALVWQQAPVVPKQVMVPVPSFTRQRAPAPQPAAQETPIAAATQAWLASVPPFALPPVPLLELLAPEQPSARTAHADRKQISVSPFIGPSPRH